MIIDTENIKDYMKSSIDKNKLGKIIKEGEAIRIYDNNKCIKFDAILLDVDENYLNFFYRDETNGEMEEICISTRQIINNDYSLASLISKDEENEKEIYLFGVNNDNYDNTRIAH